MSSPSSDRKPLPTDAWRGLPLNEEAGLVLKDDKAVLLTLQALGVDAPAELVERCRRRVNKPPAATQADAQHEDAQHEDKEHADDDPVVQVPEDKEHADDDPVVQVPEDKEPEDAQPVDAQPEDAQPVDAQPEDAQPVDAQPEDAQPVDAQPVDAQPEDAQPEDAQPEDAQPEDDDPVDHDPKDKEHADDEHALSLQPRPYRGRRRYGLWLLVLIALLATLALLVPLFLLSNIERSCDACFRAVVREAWGEPESCRPQDSTMQWLKRVPWLEREATRLDVQATQRAARLAFDLATAAQPNAAERTRAANNALSIYLDPKRYAYGGIHPRGLPGAFVAIQQRALESNSESLRAFAFSDALATGNVDAAVKLAATSGENDPPLLNLRRGAIACLGDQQQVATTALQRAQRTFARGNAVKSYPAATLTRLICQRSDRTSQRAQQRFLRFGPALAALRAYGKSPPALEDVRVVLADDKVLLGEDRLRLAGLLLAQKKPDLMATLALLVPKGNAAARFDRKALATPYSLYNRRDSPMDVLIPAPIAAAAAAHVESLVAEIPSKKKLECSGNECPVAAALAMPKDVLRAAARTYWLEAALAFAKQRNADKLYEAIDAANRLTPRSKRVDTASLLIAIGASKKALKVLEQGLDPLAMRRPHYRTRVEMLQAQAEALEHRFTKAARAAKRAYMASANATRRPKSASSGDAKQARLRQVASAWLWAATSVAADKGKSTLRLLEADRSSDMVRVSQWLRLALQPESDRRRQRWSFRYQGSDEHGLAAAMYLVGRCVEPQADLEVWLDRIFAKLHRQRPLRAMLARSLVARWRGDKAGWSRWEKRLRTLSAKSSDYRRSLLAHVAGLD